MRIPTLQQTQPVARARMSPALYGVVILLASFAITGYRLYYHNQALQLPLVYLINDPGLFPNDPFARTLPHYASTFWWVVAWVERAIPLRALLAIIFIAERVILLSSAAYLAQTIAPGSRLAAVCAMAWFALNPLPILGGGTLIASYPEQTGLSIPFLLLALAMFHRRRPLAWAAAMGIAFNLNSMYATFALTYFAAVFVAVTEYRRIWRTFIPAVALFAAISSPAILLTARALSGDSGDGSLWFAASLFRVPHHIHPSTWGTSGLTRFAGLIVITLSILNRNKADSPSLWRTARAFALVAVGWLIFAYAAEALRSPTMMILQPARATDFWYAFAGIAVVSSLSVQVTRSMRSAASGIMMLCVTLFYMSSPRVPVLLAVSALPAYLWFSMKPLRIPVRSESLAIFAVILVVSIKAVSGVASRPLVSLPSRDTMDMAAWVQRNTPEQSVFLVSPNMGAFRALTRRSAFVTWKDGSAILWCRSYTGEWAARMNCVGCDVLQSPPGRAVTSQIAAQYDAMTDASVRVIQSRYVVHYWIVRPDHPSRFPVMYTNPSFKVLRLSERYTTPLRTPTPDPRGRSHLHPAPRSHSSIPPPSSWRSG